MNVNVVPVHQLEQHLGTIATESVARNILAVRGISVEFFTILVCSYVRRSMQGVAAVVGVLYWFGLFCDLEGVQTAWKCLCFLTRLAGCSVNNFMHMTLWA